MNKKISAYAPALGLVCGAGVALLVANIFSLDLTFSIIAGAALGLIIGAIIFSFTKKE